MCEYCKRGKPIESEDGFHVLIPKMSARGEEYVLYYEDFEGSLDSFLFRFCPMCGEKVEDGTSKETKAKESQ